jgi:two-component system, NtrC family, nitrogen regulation sensor histidine kinase NtrY
LIKLLQKNSKTNLIIAIAIIWLYIIPLVANYLLPNTNNPKKVITLIENDLKKNELAFEQIATNQNLITQLIKKTYDEQTLTTLAQYPFSFQIYESTDNIDFSLKYWNNNITIPDYNQLLLPDGKHIIKQQNETARYIKKTIQIQNTKFEITCIIPIYFNYFIETDYLKKEFVANKNIALQYDISEKPTAYAVKDDKQQNLFYLTKKSNVKNQGSSWLFIICRILCLIGLCYLLLKYCLELLQQKQTQLAIIIYSTGCFILWFCLCNTNIFFYRSALTIYDDALYYLNFIFASFVHLLSFIFFIFIGILLFSKNKFSFSTALQFNITNQTKQLITIILFFVSNFLCFWLINSIIFASNISFNITNFFSLDYFSLLGFLAAAVIIFINYHIHFSFLKVQQLQLGSLLYSIFAFLLIGLFILLIIYFIDPNPNYLLPYIWSIALYFISKKTNWFKLSKLAIPASYTVLYAIAMASIFLIENNSKELKERKFFAEKLAFQSDPNTENLLNLALSKFNTDYVKNVFANNIANQPELRKKILNETFIGYLNKFQTSLYIYDSIETPISNEQNEPLAYFNTMMQNQATKVPNVPNLYFIEVGFEQFTYLYKKEIFNNNKLLGTLIIQANPLTYKNKSAALSPELFKQRNSRLDDKGNNYIYAVYSNKILRRKFFEYDIPTKLQQHQIPLQQDTIIYRNNYEELWHKINKQDVVIVGKRKQQTLSFVTLFAYSFLALLIVNALLLFYENAKETKNKKWLKTIFQFNLSKQIQSIVWMVSLLTFIVVSYVIIVQFNNRYHKNNRERLNRTMQILLTDVQNKLNTQNVFDDVVKIYEPIANAQLKEVVLKMSEIHNVDFNIYDLNGTLKISSQPFLESKGIVSNKINSIAYYNLWANESAQFVHTETIGSFKYLSMYVPIRDEKGNPYGYLNIPYYSSLTDLNQEISNFLIIIINITAFIFLIAGIIAWIISSRITNSFQYIANKMKEIELGKNEPIEWTRNDEIGELVAEYNKMVAKLSESTKLFAKNEREGAWREMARQIAHEIKNPLTPMKLSLQYLQKNIDNQNVDIATLTKKVSNTLVDQIDHLNNIASDFSSFANIGNPKQETINLSSEINQVIYLLQHEPLANIEFINNANDTNINADKTQINRLFTNIIKNALQAYDETEAKPVTVQLSTNDTKAIITISDHAKGIPIHLQDKIFTPNFTTKSSGTGLGLAICKGIVEKAGGTIHFETIQDVGTSFIISLPIAKA